VSGRRNGRRDKGNAQEMEENRVSTVDAMHRHSTRLKYIRVKFRSIRREGHGGRASTGVGGPVYDV
jgi:hypothetical protein